VVLDGLAQEKSMRHRLASSLRIDRNIGPRRYAVVCALIGIVMAASGPVVAQVCGNGIREAAEQCDDGNRADFDGCSANCRFEQTQRINQLLFEITTSAACPKNALGGAFTATAQGSLQTAINASVSDGSTSVLLYFRGLTDPAGVNNEPNLEIGLFNAAPESPTGAYSGSNDVDWWYAVDETELDTSQKPLSQLGGDITNGVLAAGPGSFLLSTYLATPVTMSFSSSVLAAPVGAASTPMTFVSGTDRGHLATEHLDPTLQSFASTGVGSPVTGSLCGNVSAESLAQAPVPASLQAGGGAAACDQGYTGANSLLDVVVFGCKTLSGLVTAVNATQPDQSDPGVSAAGVGAPYTLSSSTMSHTVDTCKDKNGTTVDLATCLKAAAYSVYFRFSTDRVIAKSTSAADTIYHDDFDAFP
jgi:cysteine-rich repeat protein